MNIFTNIKAYAVKKIKAIDYTQLLIQAVLIVAIMGIFFVPIYFIFRHVDSNLWDALISGDTDAMVEAISKYDNVFGVIIVAILQVVQDLVIIVPSAAVHLVAGMVLGTAKGFWVCHIADVFCNMFVFFVYAKLKKYVDKFITFDESNKTVQMIKEGKSKTYMIVLVCLLPAVPNGCIPYSAVNAGLSLMSYTLAVTIGCAVPTIVMVAIGASIMKLNFVLMSVLIGISFVGVFFLLRYQHHILKLLEQAKHNTMLLITEELPDGEKSKLLPDAKENRNVRRYKFSHKVVTLAEMKYQDVPKLDNPFSAFFSHKQTPQQNDAETEKTEVSESPSADVQEVNDGEDKVCVTSDEASAIQGNDQDNASV